MQVEAPNGGSLMSSPILWQCPEEEKMAIQSASEIEKATKGTILLVEDDNIVREASGEFLQTVGYRVLKARVADEAVALFCKHLHEVQVLVADLMLPGQNGRRLASYLKELQPDFRTIFISGYPEHMLAGSLKTFPDSCYLAKPFSLEALLGKVQQAFPMNAARSSEKVMRASCIG
jgi:two-component system, cell cycle sensor histidine kinase and response regulator CckA